MALSSPFRDPRLLVEGFDIKKRLEVSYPTDPQLVFDRD